MRIKCFMLEPTGRVARWLRRFQDAGGLDVRLCEPSGYHNAMVRIEDGPLLPHDGGCYSTSPLTWEEDDPRWPEKCDHCDYHFVGLRGGQLFYQQLWRAPDGKEYVVHEGDLMVGVKAPPGAMWLSYYTPGLAGQYKHKPALYVMTPGGVWCVDGPSYRGGKCGPGWDRTGTPPLVTAAPSIHFPGRYHGWLRSGELVEC